jgi:hypothetical protein
MQFAAAPCIVFTLSHSESVPAMKKKPHAIPRRKWLADAARPTAASLAIASALAVVGSTPAEAGQVRTAFKDASPLLRDKKSQVKNGGTIRLEITLWDGKKGIPNQKITFYVYYGNDDRVYVGEATTNRNGYASVKAVINDPRFPIPKKQTFTTAGWKPFNEPNAQYGAAKNNLLGTGFRVVP